MKRNLVALSVVLFLLAASLAYHLYDRRQQTAGPQALLYNPVTSQWEEVSAPPRVEITELEPHPNEDGLNNRAVVRGWFDNYDLASNQLTIKMELPFTGGQQFRLQNFQMSLDKTVYCSPSTITDQVTGQVHQTKDLGFIVKNDQVMQISREQALPFDQFYEQTTPTNYLFLQLSSSFNPQATNYISKIVVLGLCD